MQTYYPPLDVEYAKVPNQILIENINLKTPNGIKLIGDSTLSLNPRAIYGLVGLNGTGKSTLLKSIISRELEIPPNIKIIYMDQDGGLLNTDSDILDWVLNTDTEKQYLESELDKLENGDEDIDPDVFNTQLEKIEERLQRINSRSSIVQAKNILTGLGFMEDQLSDKVSTLSGGWQKRVQLAGALYSQCDLLLLDEPTNHLDFSAVMWLEQYLKTLESALIVVCHDRLFLDSISNYTIGLINKKIRTHSGTYSGLLGTMGEEERISKKSYDIELTKLEKLREGLDPSDSVKRKKITELEKQLKAQEINMSENAQTHNKLKIKFGSLDKLKTEQDLVSFRNVNFSYSDAKPDLISDLTFSIGFGERIALLGKNGCGKTTIIKLILGKLTPDDGTIYIDKTSTIRYFSQHSSEQLDMDITPLDYMTQLFPGTPQKVLEGYLCSFDLDYKNLSKPIKVLSGGQKSKLVLAGIIYADPHMIILDEITNHLDMETIDELIVGLSQYKGTLLVISHDQYFISKIADAYWVYSGHEFETVHGFDQVKKLYS